MTDVTEISARLKNKAANFNRLCQTLPSPWSLIQTSDCEPWLFESILNFSHPLNFSGSLAVLGLLGRFYRSRTTQSDGTPSDTTVDLSEKITDALRPLPDSFWGTVCRRLANELPILFERYYALCDLKDDAKDLVDRKTSFIYFIHRRDDLENTVYLLTLMSKLEPHITLTQDLSRLDDMSRSLLIKNPHLKLSLHANDLAHLSAVGRLERAAWWGLVNGKFVGHSQPAA